MAILFSAPCPPAPVGGILLYPVSDPNDSILSVCVTSVVAVWVCIKSQGVFICHYQRLTVRGLIYHLRSAPRFVGDKNLPGLGLEGARRRWCTAIRKHWEEHSLPRRVLLLGHTSPTSFMAWCVSAVATGFVSSLLRYIDVLIPKL